MTFPGEFIGHNFLVLIAISLPLSALASLLCFKKNGVLLQRVLRHVEYAGIKQCFALLIFELLACVGIFSLVYAIVLALSGSSFDSATYFALDTLDYMCNDPKMLVNHFAQLYLLASLWPVLFANISSNLLDSL